MAGNRKVHSDAFPYYQFKGVILRCCLLLIRRESQQSLLGWHVFNLSSMKYPSICKIQHKFAEWCELPLTRYWSRVPPLSYDTVLCCNSCLLPPGKLQNETPMPEVIYPHQWEVRLHLAGFWEHSAQVPALHTYLRWYEELEYLKQDLPQLHSSLR